MDNLMAAKEVAVMFSVSEETVQRWTREGKLPFVKVGGVKRYVYADIVSFVRSNGNSSF